MLACEEIYVKLTFSDAHIYINVIKIWAVNTVEYILNNAIVVVSILTITTHYITTAQW